MTKQMAAALFIYLDDTGELTAEVSRGADQEYLAAARLAAAFRQMATYVEAEEIGATPGRTSTDMTIRKPDHQPTATAPPSEGEPAMGASAHDQLTAELAAQGLPALASVTDLIAHHRANAALAATMDGIVEGRRQARAEFAQRVLDARVDHTSVCDAWTDINDSECTCGVGMLQTAAEAPHD